MTEIYFIRVYVSGKASSFEKHGKGSDDPINMANKFDGLEDGMDFS